MAVHTELQPAEISAFLVEWGLGPAAWIEGVPEGSIHTTYRVGLPDRTVYLRLSEGRDHDEVAFELQVLDRLAGSEVAAPAPIHGPGKDPPGLLKGRPAVLFEAVPGAVRSAATLGPDHVGQVGAALARLHLATEPFGPSRPNPYPPQVVSGWITDLAARPPEALDEEVVAALPLLAVALEAARDFEQAGDRGVCHADLFVDNVLWEGDRLSGLLDFEMACIAPRALDLAITFLVWTWDGVDFDPARARAFWRGYAEVRSPPPETVAAFFQACRFAAVRYAVSRVRDFLLSPLPPDRLVRKDWRRFRDRLLRLDALGPEGLASRVGPGPTP